MRKFILITWLIAGTLDGLSAVFLSLNIGPVRLFQFIASGLFGKQAFAGGWWMAVLGVLIHYFIAFIWVWLFFLLCKWFRLRGEKIIFIGVAYGIIIWLVMNLAVLPLTKITPAPFNLRFAITGTIILMLAIGLPSGIGAFRFFKKKQG